MHPISEHMLSRVDEKRFRRQGIPGQIVGPCGESQGLTGRIDREKIGRSISIQADPVRWLGLPRI